MNAPDQARAQQSCTLNQKSSREGFRVDVKADRTSHTLRRYMLVEIVGLIWVNVSARQTQSLTRQRLIGFFLAGFTSFDNVTFCEEDFLQLCPPNWFAAKQEF
jgi:hypothetical protein